MTVIIVLNNTIYQPHKISDGTMTASPPHTHTHTRNVSRTFQGQFRRILMLMFDH